MEYLDQKQLTTETPKCLKVKTREIGIEKQPQPDQNNMGASECMIDAARTALSIVNHLCVVVYIIAQCMAIKCSILHELQLQCNFLLLTVFVW